MGAGGTLFGLGTLAVSGDTIAFSSVAGNRTTNVSVAGDQDAFVGLLVSDTVKRNNQELLVSIENNTNETISLDVSLDDCNHGTLFGPNGSGCTVSLTLDPGVSVDIDVEAAVKDTTIPFTISTNSSNTADFEFQATRSTEAVAGNTSGAINIKKLEGFLAHDDTDNWTIRDIDIRDADGDDDLDRIEFEVEDDAGNVVASRTDTCGCTGGSKYSPNGNPAVSIEPDDSSYDVIVGDSFKLTVTAYDADGNFEVATREDTA